jgi:hypothetical protein
MNRPYLPMIRMPQPLLPDIHPSMGVPGCPGWIKIEMGSCIQ